jgi:ATP-dependent DNA helicase DinG
MARTGKRLGGYDRVVTNPNTTGKSLWHHIRVTEPTEDSQESMRASNGSASTDERQEAILTRVREVYDQVMGGLGRGGEERPGQRSMIRRGLGALAHDGQVVVQAGTGVGKSLGYLVPAVAALRAGLIERVVVATATKALQDQLMNKDLPLVLGDRPGAFSALKGRSNYLCLAKLEQMRRENDDAMSLLGDQDTDPEAMRQFQQLLDWHEREMAIGGDGDRASLSGEVSDQLWNQVSCSAEECPGAKHCHFGNQCWAELAQRRARDAEVVVANHHLWVLGLVNAKEEGSTLLPPHQLLVLDEAHELVDIASRALGCQLSPGQIRGRAGAAGRLLGRRHELVQAMLSAADQLDQVLDHRSLEPGQRLETAPVQVRQQLQDVLDNLMSTLAWVSMRCGEQTGDGDAGGDTTRRSAWLRMGKMADALQDVTRQLMTPGGHNATTWIDESGIGKRSLVRAVIDPSPVLRTTAWEPGPASILCSATLTATFPRWVGLSGGSRYLGHAHVDSPFDYKSNGILYVPTDLPNPSDRNQQDKLRQAQLREIKQLLCVSKGNALVLFTSWGALRWMGEQLERDWELPGPLLRQDSNMSRNDLMDAFIHKSHSVLMGVRSFWQGVDVQGEALRLVIIDRIPFPSPTDPLLSAREDLVKSEGGNGFREVSLPAASQLLAQGVGRLIRSARDWGAVAVLDPRLAEAGYKDKLLDQLPPMRRTRRFAQVQSWFKHHLAQEMAS